MGMGVGISSLIAIKAATLFIIFTYLINHGFTLLSIPFLYSSLISFLISVASHPLINLPMLLGKTSDGLFSALRRMKSGEPPYSMICEGLYVGGWPSSLDKLPPGNPAVIDCTCELPRIIEVTGTAYLCVPTFDTRSPQPSEIEAAVKWGCRKRSLNLPVFVHCAYGHGRSVAVMCALLVSLGMAEDWKNAEKLIKEKRPYIRMNALHRAALEEWSKHRLSSPRQNQEHEHGGVTSRILSDASGRS